MRGSKQYPHGNFSQQGEESVAVDCATKNEKELSHNV